MAKFPDNYILELKESPHYPNEINMVINYLTIESEIEHSDEYPIYYICKCGKEVIRERGSIKNSSSFKSCGCYLKEFNIKTKSKHNAAKHKNGKQKKLYKIWSNMISRCNNPKNSSYKNYGAVGIGICKEWEDYKTFEKWAKKNGYKKNLSIDRKENNKGYYPDNCRWVTRNDQNRNKRNNSIFLIDGEWISQVNLAKKFGVVPLTIRNWANSGKLKFDDWKQPSKIHIEI